MRRLLLSYAIAGIVLAVPAAALAAPVLPPHPRALTGTLTSEGQYSFAVQKAGRQIGVINALIDAANRVTAEDYPYVWGGGHAQAGIASVGERGPGFNGRRRGYDCSGAVAAVLAGAGLWPAGAAVPNDIGVIRYLRLHREIAPGAGTGPQEVTLYDDPGVHIFMNIDGRFFGTSDGGAGGDPKGGPGWLEDAAADVYKPRFHRYHVLPSVLRATTDAGFISGFQYAPSLVGAGALPLGITVRVVYTPTRQGTMVAQSVTPLGESTVTGTLQAVAPGASAFTVANATGQLLTLPAPAGTAVAQSLADGALAVGDGVSVTYVSAPSIAVIAVTVTSAATTTTTPTTTTTTSTTPTSTTATSTTATSTTATSTTATSTTPISTALPSSSNTGGVALGG